MKLLQLNLFQGKFLDRIIDLVKREDFDILTFQEVTGGKFSKGGINNYLDIKFINKMVNPKTIGIDCFKELKKNMGYKGELCVNERFVNDNSSYHGNATFYKNFNLLSKKDIRMKPYQEFKSMDEINPAFSSRSATVLQLERNNKTITVINLHLAWGPTPFDEPYKLEQAEKLFEFVKSLKAPYILSGDFNLDPSSQVISWFEKIARNLSKENKLTNTLNPRVHSVSKLFPPGLAVDYMFTSREIKVKSFKLITEPDLSDHFGLLLEFEI